MKISGNVANKPINYFCSTQDFYVDPGIIKGFCFHWEIGSSSYVYLCKNICWVEITVCVNTNILPEYCAI